MSAARFGALLLCCAGAAPALGADAAAADAVPAGIVTRLPTRERVVALTFDACQAVERMHLDHGITDFLVARQVPFTVFMGGRFARDNADDVRELARHPFVSIQNHSWSHPRDLRLLDDDRVRAEVTRAEAMLTAVTGRRPTLFRFPGGNADERTVAIVRALGYQVVHWRWAEGDPAPAVDADRLVAQTLERTRAGDILIFHVNGRGWHTAEALPRIVDGLAARGFRFVTVADALAATGAAR
ncbi:MAG TPA: polysaccharide deacetylase family protein [Steroidobacteraceae bacterium]|nr:polysaccharide deacetylase family protein [Steroidobacteraceae bacterium]